PPVKVFVSRLVGRVIPFLPVGNELEPEKLSSDPEFQEKTRRDPLYNHVTTPRWFTETMAVQEEVIRRASEITAPILMLQAGADTIADPEAARQVFDAFTSRDKTFEIFEGFKHELFMERGRERPMHALFEWIDARL
ncbi:MAG: alpha/beta hydrolase, partial [Deltaproteobacteria bacterium]